VIPATGRPIAFIPLSLPTQNFGSKIFQRMASAYLYNCGDQLLSRLYRYAAFPGKCERRVQARTRRPADPKLL
jgi:hypothetical protein